MNNFIEWLKKDEDMIKMIVSSVLLIAGLISIFISILIHTHVIAGLSVLLFILGMIAGILGGIPLVNAWISWHNL